jgi:hypothetical protein
MAEARPGIGLPVATEQHDAGSLVESAGLRKERGCLPELAA